MDSIEETTSEPKEVTVLEDPESVDSGSSEAEEGSEAEENEDGLSDEDDDNDSEREVHPNSPPSGSSTDNQSESSEEDIVYEHALKHRSFFETARKRRRRHTVNRMKGLLPSLHFNGTHKTHFWYRYGVEPHEELPSGNVQGIDTMFSDDEFKKLGPTERRIHVNGQKFKIVPSETPTRTLYTAIANAVGLFGEGDHKIVREVIIDEISSNWSIYSGVIFQYCLIWEKEGRFYSPQDEPVAILETYLSCTAQCEPPPDVELNAAAIHFGFNYSIMDLEDMESPLKVQNCADVAVLQNGTVKYHFLRSGVGSDSIRYEFLLPIGPLKKIQDGEYPVVLQDVILVDRARPGQLATAEVINNDNDDNGPMLGPVPVGLALDHRIFFHRSTISHDLWSLLAELLFGKFIHAPQIKRKIVNSRHNFALYYLACKAKKRYQVSGNPEIQKLADEFHDRFSRENPRGDAEDLAQAAAQFDFSYTLLGMDVKGNFYWVDRVASRDDSPYLAFFVKTAPDKSTYWFSLEDLGRLCPKERKLYGDVQSGNLRIWRGRFYFHYAPRNGPQKVATVVSSKKIANVSTKLLSQRKKQKQTSDSVARLHSSIAASYSETTQRSRSTFQRIMGFLRWFIYRRRAKPNKKVQALFVREQP